MASRLYRRMRLLACRYWSCAPPQLDAWVDEGRVSTLDVIELIFMLSHDPLTAIWLMDYLYPEAKAKQEAKDKRNQEAAEQRKREEQWQITALRMLNQCKPQNDDEAGRIAALRESLK